METGLFLTIIQYRSSHFYNDKFDGRAPFSQRTHLRFRFRGVSKDAHMVLLDSEKTTGEQRDHFGRKTKLARTIDSRVLSWPPIKIRPQQQETTRGRDYQRHLHSDIMFSVLSNKILTARPQTRGDERPHRACDISNPHSLLLRPLNF